MTQNTQNEAKASTYAPQMERVYNKVNDWHRFSITSKKATLEVVMRRDTPERVSIVTAMGQQAELVRHIEKFRKMFPTVRKMVNQAYAVDEIKAMHKAGFRCKNAEHIGLEETIKLAQNDGETMFWER